MKKISIFIICTMLCSMLAGFSVSAASDPGMLIDFSDDPYFDGVGGAMDYNFINDGDARVAEITAYEDGADLYSSFYPGDFTDNETLAADTYQWIKFSIKNVSVCPIFEMHFGGSAIGIDARCCTHFAISSEDTEYKTYVYNMKDANKATFPVHPDADFSDFEDTSCWTEDISTVRLDFGYIEEPGGMAPEGINMYIQYVAFFDSEEAANAWEYKPMKTAADYQPKETEAPVETEAEPEPAEETTEAPVETEPDSTVSEESPADDTTAPATSDSSDDGSNSMVLWIVIAAVAVVAVIVVVVVVSKGKNK